MAVSCSDLPRVGILPHRAVNGINRLDEARHALEVRDLYEALTRKHTTDAHFTTYELVGESQWPRLNKPVLSQLREKGVLVKSRLLVFDFDNPAHAEWTRESYEAFETQLAHVTGQEPLLNSYYAYYTTKSGARLVYVLAEPVEVSVQEEMLCGMQQLFAAKGLTADPLFDWTRLFRLPWVIRDGKETWIPDYFPFGLLELNKDFAPIPVERVPQVPLHRDTPTKAIEPIAADLPDLDHIESLVWTNAAVGERTPWYVAAKVRLQGRPYWDALFRNLALAEEGNRSNEIFRSVGSAVGLLISLKGTTPEHIFALFLPSIQSMAEDPNNRESWEEMLWRAVRTSWEREAAKSPDTVYAGLLSEIRSTDLIKGIIDGVRRWCVAAQSLSDDDVWRIFERKLILVGHDVFYVMKPNGFYDDCAVVNVQLVPRIHDLGMDSLIQTTSINDKGQVVPLTADKIARAYGCAVFECLGSLQHDAGSWLRDIMDAAPIVCEPMYSLSPTVVPEYNQVVDAWLRHLAGSRYELLCNWIGHSLDFSKPIAALFLEGPPSVGKKMLAIGLAENLRVPMLAGAEEITSRFKTQILHTPFIFCNEGFPTARGAGTKRPADSFREMIDGSPIYVDRKFQKPIVVRAPYRLLITANNSNGIRGLYGKQDLTPEDRDALNIRLVHISCDASAAVWLKKMGGLAYTGASGNRWISGDAGEMSNFLVARHFRYLYENRKAPEPGYRFLVEGQPDSEFVQEMSLNSGLAPVVLEVVFSMIQQQTKPTGFALDKEHGTLVTAEGVLTHAKAIDHPLRRDLNLREVGGVLRGFATQKRLYLGESAQKRWWSLDLGLLWREAEHGGSSAAEKIKQLIEDGYNYKAPTDEQ
jgi:hypothetical protein